METWLTYIAALLMAGVTAFTFSFSTSLMNIMSTIASFMTGLAALLFLVTSFITISAGTASLRKDHIEKKALGASLLWAAVTTLCLSFLGTFLASFFPAVFPVSSTAGGEYQEILSSFTSTIDILNAGSILSKFFIPVALAAVVFGLSITPSSDVIRPAYAVMNSFSEAMYRIQRTLTYFGGLYIYVTATAFFLGIWNEKTAFVAPEPFISLLIGVLIVVLVVLPLLFAIFTKFKVNPWGVVGRSSAGMITGFISSNIYVSALIGEPISRSNLGIQKRISSTSTPLAVIVSRGGTAFVSTAVVITLLTTLGAEISTSAAVAIAVTVAVLSLLSSFSAGFEVVVVCTLLFKTLNINVYGAEAAIIALLPILNGCAILIDTLIALMTSSIIGVWTKTNVKIPLKDTI